MTLSDSGLLIGSWTLWGFGLLTVIARLASRWMLLGSFRKFQLDDYLMLVTTIAYTGVVVSSNQVAANGSNYVPDGVVDTWSTQQVQDAIWGSKMLVALEECMLMTLWCVKACLLILYDRMTPGLREGELVKLVAVYCALGYAVIQILYLGIWCRPIYNYWAVPIPVDQPQCKSYRNHMITVTVLHVSSDLAMLCIPLPMIIRARLPLRRKLVLTAVFSLGVFVVLVAILNRYYNFTEDNSLVFLSWYNGEATTAVMIANIPFCWTLMRRLFSLDKWGGSSRQTEDIVSGQSPPTIGEARVGLARRYRRESVPWTECNESIERITENQKDQGYGHGLEVFESTEVEGRA